jgi:hypothetical protein
MRRGSYTSRCVQMSPALPELLRTMVSTFALRDETLLTGRNREIKERDA